MTTKNILIELPNNEADDFLGKLNKEGVEIVGSDRIDSLDGTTIAAIIVTITPVVGKFIIDLIKTIKGSVVIIDGKRIEGKNLTTEELAEVLDTKDNSAS